MGLHKSKLNVAQIQKKAVKYDGMKSLRLEALDINSFVNAEGYNDVTPLWLAVRFNDVDLADLLIKAEADVNMACSELKMTPLHIAAMNHNVKMVKLLLVNGAQIDVLDAWNYSPLMYAAIHYEPYTVDQLLMLMVESGCDVNFGSSSKEPEVVQENAEGIHSFEQGNTKKYMSYMREPMGATSGTALHHAAQNPHLPTSSLEILIDAGADVNIDNSYGQGAIIGALMDTFYDFHKNVKGHVELLLKKGTLVNKVDCNGWSPLHYACQRASIPCIELLLTYGANTDMIGNNGETPLWILLVNGQQDAAVNLVRNGCDLNIPMESRDIIAMNVDVDICRYGNILPVEFAICNKYYDLAKVMLIAKCDFSSGLLLSPSSLSDKRSKYYEFLCFYEDLKQKNRLVPSLASSCRNALRKQLHRGICLKVESLQLPQSLKDFICLE